EMSLDIHRYGALLVLDRWAALVRAFGGHLQLSRHPDILTETAGRVQTAENILARVNQVIDAASQYTGDLVNGCTLALQSLSTTFAEERQAAEEISRLGPMLPEDYHQARRVFLEDLAAR
ncbi:MAG TPA: hypothetical protein VG672_15190, partial [Bryobacteraceae bacterium]|nr:hypothetical protein [Bryobacteraceae bacterium]